MDLVGFLSPGILSHSKIQEEGNEELKITRREYLLEKLGQVSEVRNKNNLYLHKIIMI